MATAAQQKQVVTYWGLDHSANFEEFDRSFDELLKDLHVQMNSDGIILTGSPCIWPMRQQIFTLELVYFYSLLFEIPVRFANCCYKRPDFSCKDNRTSGRYGGLSFICCPIASTKDDYVVSTADGCDLLPKGIGNVWDFCQSRWDLSLLRGQSQLMYWSPRQRAKQSKTFQEIIYWGWEEPR